MGYEKRYVENAQLRPIIKNVAKCRQYEDTTRAIGQKLHIVKSQHISGLWCMEGWINQIFKLTYFRFMKYRKMDDTRLSNWQACKIWKKINSLQAVKLSHKLYIFCEQISLFIKTSLLNPALAFRSSLSKELYFHLFLFRSIDYFLFVDLYCLYFHCFFLNSFFLQIFNQVIPYEALVFFIKICL